MIRLFNADCDSEAVKTIFEENGFFSQNEQVAEETNTSTYVYEKAGEILGAICFARNLPTRLVNGLMARTILTEDDRACVINAMVVKPEYRGGGIGSALMAFAFAKDCRCTKIVLAARPGTEPYYERVGFVPTGQVTAGHAVMVLDR